jgi:hypothetical protein
MRPFNPKDAIIKAGSYTPYPNWFWDHAARCLPAWLIVFWGVLLRNSVGYGRQKVVRPDRENFKSFSQRELAEETGLPTDAVSRSARFLAAARLIEYAPGAGNRAAEIIVWPEGKLPDLREREAAFGAIMQALDYERKERTAGGSPSVKTLCEIISRERTRYLAGQK